jgi:hypothetical protein
MLLFHVMKLVQRSTNEDYSDAPYGTTRAVSQCNMCPTRHNSRRLSADLRRVLAAAQGWWWRCVRACVALTCAQLLALLCQRWQHAAALPPGVTDATEIAELQRRCKLIRLRTMAFVKMWISRHLADFSTPQVWCGVDVYALVVLCVMTACVRR